MANDTPMQHSTGKLRQVALVVGFVGVLILTGGVAQAGHSLGHFNFSERIPRFGSQTYSREYRTTTAYLDINIQYDKNPYTLHVKPVGCGSAHNDISGYKQITAGDHSWKVIASSVLNGTCYQLNMAADTTNYFDVVGDLHS